VRLIFKIQLVETIVFTEASRENNRAGRLGCLKSM